MKVLVSHNNTVGYFRYQMLGKGDERKMEEQYSHTSNRILSHGFNIKRGELSDGTKYNRLFLKGTVVTLFVVDEKKAKMMFL